MGSSLCRVLFSYLGFGIQLRVLMVMLKGFGIWWTQISNMLNVNFSQLVVCCFSDRNWNMWVPGFGSDELRPYKKAATTEAHKQRMALIKKTLKKYWHLTFYLKKVIPYAKRYLDYFWCEYGVFAMFRWIGNDPSICSPTAWGWKKRGWAIRVFAYMNNMTWYKLMISRILRKQS